MSADWNDHPLWEAVVAPVCSAGPAAERRSRYGDKPALFIGGREIAHLEAPGIVDLRITRSGWSTAKDEFAEDPAVRRDSSRRDWIESRLECVNDVNRVSGLLRLAVAANTAGQM